ncbi:CCAMK [Symbiodinium microadriaticum]|nr:CCAMK [Symbiodinium microadriaticum]
MDGVVQLIGVFMDPLVGMSEIYDTKIWQKRYPVIVMECLEGGMLHDRVHRKHFMSEKILREIFRGFVIGLQGIHSRGFLHRDLKLENVMLESYADDSPVKIIDLGMMVHLPPGTNKYIAEKISGTRGYLAPESILKMEYSTASDVWQVGCVLYTMLSGMLPFHPSHLEQAIKAKYYAMSGPAWEKICPAAKDLVKRLLVREPLWRLSLQEVLQHDWMQTGCYVSDKDLGEVRGRARYISPVRDSKQKPVGMDDVALVLPQMMDLASLRGANQGNRGLPLDVSIGTDDPSLLLGPSQELSLKPQISLTHDLSVRTFKLRLHNIHGMMATNDDGNCVEADHGQLDVVAEESGQDDSEKAVMTRNLRSFALPPEEIDYENFVNVLTKAGLQALATPRVFDLFDVGSKGSISLREFLVTMLAVQPSQGDAHSPDTKMATGPTDTRASDEDCFIRMFFSIFDIDNDGSINREEFALALQHLDDITPHTAPTGDEEGEGGSNSTLLEGSAQHTLFLANVEELFQEIDVDKSGKIDFGEFKCFYCEDMEAAKGNGF